MLAFTAGVPALLLLFVPLTLITANLMHWTWGPWSFWPGAAMAHYSLGLAVLALMLTCAFLLRLLLRWREGAWQEIAWHGPPVLIALFVVNAAAVLPVLDHARDYRPVAQLVQHVIGPGGRIGFIYDRQGYIDERDTGAFSFYLGRRMDSLPLNARLSQYLFNGRQPAGVLIRREQLGKAQRVFKGLAVRWLQTVYTGYKAREYILVVPATHMLENPAHDVPKPLKK